MTGEKNLKELLKKMTPVLNPGEYVFLTVSNADEVDRKNTLFEFKEKEGVTVVVEREIADKLNFTYDYVASWITLMVHSSLNAVGFTAAISTTLAENNISCNVVAGYYHDHIFVAVDDAQKAINLLKNLAEKN
ncbi:ACT domain-containing protein [Draconibacterium sp. IB214405]|uniref:ACT domain-containing protein n=1 Tax=Draconibacterium sp. IB214405 TaxID=3097352 RepID=UPI002A12C461|nr:ACT domain-containing protein [Draconibacterium sp. IB214405]MDX8339127.1 ACT domain-containing protein [Draconibacterium sp. IB214405]